MTTWTLGRICVRSPLPSLVTMIEVPVSAIEEIRAGHADVGGRGICRAGCRAPRRAAARAATGRGPAGRSRCALRKSASTSSRVTWIAGAMMCEGASPRSWMMYSPRSVSIASMPSASSAALRPISSEIIDLPLVTALAPRALQRSRKIRRASAASRAKCTWPPTSVDLALVGLEIEVEMGERVVLDVAGAVAQRVELGQPSHRFGAPRHEIAGVMQRALQPRVAQRLVDVFLETRRRDGRAHGLASSALSPIGGSSRHSREHLGDVADPHRSTLALHLARHVHEAAEIAGEQGVGAARGDIGALLRDDRVGQLAVFGREGSAEAAADFAVREIDQPQPFDAREQLARLPLDAQLAQARAGIVIGDDRRRNALRPRSRPDVSTRKLTSSRHLAAKAAAFSAMSGSSSNRSG